MAFNLFTHLFSNVASVIAEKRAGCQKKFGHTPLSRILDSNHELDLVLTFITTKRSSTSSFHTTSTDLSSSPSAFRRRYTYSCPTSIRTMIIILSLIHLLAPYLSLTSPPIIS